MLQGVIMYTSEIALLLCFYKCFSSLMLISNKWDSSVKIKDLPVMVHFPCNAALSPLNSWSCTWEALLA